MNLDHLLQALNLNLLELHENPLNVAEVIVLKGICFGQTYSQMAQSEDYSTGYISNIVAPELYRKISKLMGQPVTKKNCRLVLQLYDKKQESPQIKEIKPEIVQNIESTYPSGAIPLNSPFYVEWSAIHRRICQELRKSGSLVRIKAPQQMGKTSLLLRVLEDCRSYGYATVSVSLDKIDQSTFADLNQFLRRLCKYIARKLKLDPKLDEYWDTELDGKMNWTLYFEDYLLTEIDAPIVLALDEMNQIFEHPNIAQDFLPLLRSCYEDAQRLPLWQKLRLIVVHNTEIYVPLRINQSPFNVGLPIQLEEFTLEQVQGLAERYGLNWVDNTQAQQLMELVGGHPSLIHIALYHLSRQEIILEELLEKAATSSGIYFHHLQRHWVVLREQPELWQFFALVVRDHQPLQLDTIMIYKLRSLGLIQELGDRIKVQCELYRRYFSREVLAQE